MHSGNTARGGDALISVWYGQGC